MAQLIEGRAIADKVYAELRSEISSLKERGITPGLAVVLGPLPDDARFQRLGPAIERHKMFPARTKPFGKRT